VRLRWLGAKGQHFCDWAFIRLDPSDPTHGGQRCLIVRRSRTTGELAYYHWWMPHPVPLGTCSTWPAGAGDSRAHQDQ
jgi:hypothetical protein